MSCAFLDHLSSVSADDTKYCVGGEPVVQKGKITTIFYTKREYDELFSYVISDALTIILVCIYTPEENNVLE
jgi:hypothetical protein